MDDGSKDKGCIRINSQNFSFGEHLILQKVLENKFGLKCNIHKDKEMFRFWVKSETMPTLIRLIKPYFISSMLYKLPRNDFDCVSNTQSG